jgi:hypothetical protein
MKGIAMNNNNIVESVAANIESISGYAINTFTIFKVFNSNANTFDIVKGIVIQLRDENDENYPDGRIVRQIAFDSEGNHYRFWGSEGPGFPIFQKTNNWHDHYGGFTPYEIIELVRLRDWIISQ